MSEHSNRQSTAPSRWGRYRLKINTLDRLTSLLVSLLVLASATLFVLLTLFLFRARDDQQTVKLPGLQYASDSLRASTADISTELEFPSQADLLPSIEPRFEETLRELTKVGATPAAFKNSKIGWGHAGNRSAHKKSHGPASRNSSSAEGPIDPPRELRFDAQSAQDYAKMIDHFGGELAVVDPKQKRVYYAKSLSAAKPSVRVGTPVAENKANRFRFLSTGPPLQPLEVKLARKAGIMKPDAILMVFYPDEFAKLIYKLEQAELHKQGHQSTNEIFSTVYRVRKDHAGYSLVVEKQTYH